MHVVEGVECVRLHIVLFDIEREKQIVFADMMHVQSPQAGATREHNVQCESRTHFSGLELQL